MTLTKILATAALVPLVVGVGAADAAKPKPKPKPKTCFIMTDIAKDGTGTGNGTPAVAPDDPSLDLLSADIATNAKTLTAVWRVSNVTPANTTSAPTGRAYTTTFNVRGQVVTVRAILSPAGDKWGDGGTGKVDPAKNEVRMHIPLAKLAVPIKPNEKLTDFSATTWRWVGTTNATLGLVDRANGVKTYNATWPSCVTVGA